MENQAALSKKNQEKRLAKNNRYAIKTGEMYHIAVVPCWVVRIRILEGRKSPLKNEKYVLSYGSQRYEGTTDGNGILEQEVSFEIDNAVLLIKDLIIPLEIGALPSINSIEGVQARLNNLGYECGKVDGKSGENTRAAIRGFQRENPSLHVTGSAGDETQQELFKAHGI